MNLTTLLTPLEKYDASGLLDVEITGLSYDSKKVQPGDLFAALPGIHHHGTEFVNEAQKAGASAILSNRKTATSLPYILVDQPRLALAKMSSLFYQRPSTKLKIYGVTGTNGKTTSTFLLRSILEQAGFRCGMLGTIQYSSKAFATPAPLTTPESLDLQRYLAQMVDEHCEACVMEVSSHSLAQYRVGGCLFESAIFTNLTQDHLDYHRTMEEYFQAKWMLFSNQTCETRSACINFDDSYGKRIYHERRNLGLPSFRYGFEPGVEFQVANWKSSTDSSEILIRSSEGETTIRSPLIGRYNAYNIAGVYAATISTGLNRETVKAGIEQMSQVPGRLERINLDQPYLILIDYAHTEDALRQLLTTVRPYVQNRLILLFGCGGERDRAKRPLMGMAAAELSDEIILTSDNPRGENPREIIQDIRAGVDRAGFRNVHEFIDRKEAIAFATQIAGEGDVLVLAGKGHEDYQVIGKEKQHFDEREILRDIFTTETKRRRDS